MTPRTTPIPTQAAIVQVTATRRRESVANMSPGASHSCRRVTVSIGQACCRQLDPSLLVASPTSRDSASEVVPEALRIGGAVTNETVYTPGETL